MSIKVDLGAGSGCRQKSTTRGRVLRCHTYVSTISRQVNRNDLLLLLPYIQHRGKVINFISASKELINELLTVGLLRLCCSTVGLLSTKEGNLITGQSV